MSDSRVVWGEGPPSAKIIIIGQNPGPDEMDEGKPFVGGSGRVLNRALHAVGLSRTRCYVTNVVKHYVPPGKPVPPYMIEQDRHMLERELETLKDATTILTLGQEAFNSLTGKKLSIRHNRKSSEKDERAWLRGCPFQLGRYWIIPAVHPSFIMRTGFIESPLFEVDLNRARRFGEGALPPTEHFNQHPTTQEVQEYVRECVEAGECGVDIETPETAIDDDELDPLYETPIELIGLSARIGESIGVTPDQFDLLKPLFQNPHSSGRKTIVWGHNSGNFDFYHLGKKLHFGGVRRADCMLGMHLLWSHLSNKDAATCFSIFCDIPYYKNTRLLDPEFYNTIGNCRDTYGALWAGQSILREMRKFPGMEQLFWNHVMPLCDLMNDWRVTGVNTDTELSQRMLLISLKTLQKYDQWWTENIPQFSWSSPKQLIELFASMGLKIYKRKRQKKDASGFKSQSWSDTMDDEALEIYVKQGNKTAGLVQTMRTLKHSGDFLQMAKSDGKIHPRFKLHGQVGGRIQAVDGNVMTIPVRIGDVFPRSQIVPDKPEDQVLFVADFSQIEYRLYVTQAQDQCGIDQVNSGDYLYGFFYEDIFEEPFFEPGQLRQKRFMSKTVPDWKLLVAKSWPLGFIYGRGVPDNSGLPITLGKCKEIYKEFHAKHPKISAHHTELILRATRDGLLVSPFGRMRRFPNPQGQRNDILSFPGQVVAVDVLVRNALIPLGCKTHSQELTYDCFKEETYFRRNFGGRVMFSVHDSVVGCCAKSALVDCVGYVKECMQSPLPELNGLVIPVEVKVGPNWHAIKSLESYAAESGRTINAV